MTEREIGCDEALKQVFAYLDRELSEHDQAAMRRHLHTCKGCFSRMEFERLLKGKVRELREAEASPGVRRRVKALLKGF
jgi:anti-sigma factor (TIGR02949 family)